MRNPKISPEAVSAPCDHVWNDPSLDDHCVGCGVTPRALLAAMRGDGGWGSGEPARVCGVARMIDDVIRREGGYVDHPADRGGPTKYGITLATLSGWRGERQSAQDVMDLEEFEARAIYEARYYRDPGIDKLPPSIQPFVFDAAVNHGSKRAIELVQAVCIDAGYDPGPIDGIVGPRTIKAAHRYVRAFLDHLIAFREGYYREIVASDPSQQVFLAGWMNRLDEFRNIG